MAIVKIDQVCNNNDDYDGNINREGDSRWKRVEMLAGNFKINPKGYRSFTNLQR